MPNDTSEVEQFPPLPRSIEGEIFGIENVLRKHGHVDLSYLRLLIQRELNNARRTPTVECTMGKPVNGCKGCPDCMGIVGKE